MKKDYILYAIIVILVLSNIFTFTMLKVEESNNRNDIALEVLKSTVETMDNSYNIYQFSKYQYEQGAIDSEAYTTTLQNIINIHKKLQTINNEKINNKKLSKIKEIIDITLKTRVETYENFKNAIELSSDNFNNVANQKFSDSENLKEQLKTLLNNKK